MKKKLFTLMAVLSIGAVMFTGCGDDELDKEEAAAQVNAIITYKEKKEALEAATGAVDSLKDAVQGYLSDEEYESILRGQGIEP